MKTWELLQLMEEIAPFCLAEKNDNVGLLVGDMKQEIETVLVAVDATMDVITEATQKGAQLIIAHHPLMYSPIQGMIEDEVEQRIIRRMIQNGIGLISFHTNYDAAVGGLCWKLAEQCGMDVRQDGLLLLSKGGQREIFFLTHGVSPKKWMEWGAINAYEFGDRVCALVSGLMESGIVAKLMKYGIPYSTVATREEGSWGYGLIGEIDDVTTRDLAARVKRGISATCVKYTGDPKKRIRRLAIACGSGGDVCQRAIEMGADAIVTGELRYHEALQFTQMGLTVLEAGHFDTEKIMIMDVSTRLQKCADALQCSLHILEAESGRDVYTGVA